jgi:branched-chain amino acid aminotransferase
MSHELASINGSICSVEEAVIPATDDGLLRGDGVFEVMRLYAGRPFAIKEHFERMAFSAKNLRLDFEPEILLAEAETLLSEYGERDGCLRLVVTRGGNRVILTEPLPEIGLTVSLASVSYQPTGVLDGVKSLSYAANMLAGRIAREKGADEALLVTPDGIVLEAPTSTFFWVEGDQLYTPPLADRILESITRRYVFTLTGALERSVTLDEMLSKADEAFLASTTREVQAVSAVDGREFSSPGPFTSDLSKRCHEMVTEALETV